MKCNFCQQEFDPANLSEVFSHEHTDFYHKMAEGVKHITGEQVWSIGANQWQPIETAPKDGTPIEINYGTKELPDVCEAVWSERPVCMGGPTIYNAPGWATTGTQTDSNLPLDTPNYWRHIL